MAKVRYVGESRVERDEREHMSAMREQKVVAVLCSDIHISHKPPLFRSAEPDWYAAQYRVLDEVRSIASEYEVFLVCAGDVFDKWNPPPELINFAMDVLPHCMWAIPGQHDLPYHRYDDIQKSAYWTLVHAGRIKHISPEEPVEIRQVRLHGFPYGFEVKPFGEPHDLLLEVAVAHQYVWAKGQGYQGAPEESRLGNIRSRLEGYDAAVFGDNHCQFLSYVPIGGGLLNCGSLMIRKSDDKHHPAVGLLHSDGTITRRKLDISQDKYLDVKEVLERVVAGEADIEEFVLELVTKSDLALDFASVVRRELEGMSGVRDGVRRVILAAMEEES